MSDRDKKYIRHILDAISDVAEFLNGVSETDFKSSGLVQSAVMRKIEIIGEASKRISLETKLAYSDIEWKKAAGMRDVLIHDYFGVDIQGVWNTVQENLPRLKRQLEKLISG